MHEKLLKRSICVLSILGIACSIAVLFPAVQRMIIRLAEEYLIHRKVNYYDDWMATLSAWARGCIGLIVIFDFFAIVPYGNDLFKKIMGDTKSCLFGIDYKMLLKPVLIMAGIYMLGMVSIIRADFFYVDDIDRAVEGYHGWNGWSRHLADVLSTFIHADPILTEISPLPQMLALCITAISSVVLVYVLCNGKISLIPLLASIPLGLSPYFLENLSYKYDAPYMALSVLAGIVPFLFTGSRPAFMFISIVSLLVMCMSYQASSGIYIMLAIVIFFLDWNYRRKTNKELLGFFLSTVLSYAAALIIFRLVFMVQGISGHGVSTEALSLKQLIPGMLSNLRTYSVYLNNGSGLLWKIGAALICLLFIVEALKSKERSKIVTLVVSIVGLSLLFTMSYGVYIILENPLFVPRALCGIGAFIAIIGICIVSRHSKPGIICVLALCWSFFVFAFSYGNVLADQKRYTDFRVQILLQDLSTLFPERSAADIPVFVQNPLGYGPLTENVARHYPLIKQLVPNGLTYNTYKYMNNYFHWERGSSANEPDSGGDKVLLDSYYHTIQSDGSRILVSFKHGGE